MLPSPSWWKLPLCQASPQEETDMRPLSSAFILACIVCTSAQGCGGTVDPKDVDACIHHGLAWAHEGEYDKAIADYDEAVRLDPKNASVYCFRGDALNKKLEYDKAIADYDEAIRLDPKKALAFYCRGSFWDGKGKYDRAIADYDEAIRLDPTKALVYCCRGNIWDGKGEYDKAIADYDEAIRLDPDYPLVHYYLAQLLATCPIDACRDTRKAIEHATKACQLTEWKVASSIAVLALAHGEASDFKEAVKWQTMAVSLCSEDHKDFYEECLDFYKHDSVRPYHQAPKR